MVARNQRLLGSGADDSERVYRIGPHQELLGRPAPLTDSGADDVELASAADFSRVDADAGYVPVHVVGRITDGGDPGRDVAVAVNGRFVGVGNSFTLATGDEGELFSVMVPPSAFRPGRNRVDVFEVAAGGEPRRLGGS